MSASEAGVGQPEINSPFCAGHGFELTGYGDGWASIACHVVPAHTNRHGNAHGGLVAALLDTSMGVATRADGTLENLGTVTLNISYLRPGRGRVVAQGRMLRSGGKLAFCEARALDASGALIATASGVFVIARRSL